MEIFKSLCWGGLPHSNDKNRNPHTHTQKKQKNAEHLANKKELLKISDMTAKLKNSIEVLENKVEENSQGVKQIGKMTDGKFREKT